MATLRNTQIQLIIDSIEQSKDFTRDDFKLNFPDSNNIFATIQYRGLSKYYFHIEENTLYGGGIFTITNQLNGNGKTTLQTVEAPGEYKNKQTKNHNNIEDCIYQIKVWLKNLSDDLKHMHVYSISEITDMDKIQEILDEKIEDEEEKFSDEERINLEKKLQELQERIEKLENDGAISSEDAKQTVEIIEQSKDNLQTYPKKAWYLNFYNKMKNTDGVLKTLSGMKSRAEVLLEWFSW